MSNLFAFLFLITPIFLIWGLISPKGLSRITRKVLRRRHIGLLFGCLIFVFALLTGETYHQPVGSSPRKVAVSNAADKQETPTAPKITTSQTTETQAIAFSSSSQDDANLPKGQTQVAQTGKNGVMTLIYKVTYTNGAQTSKTLMSKTVTTQPVNEIIDIGTYVAPAPPQPVEVDPTPSPTPIQSCHPLTNGGNCYESGEYCRNSDHGVTGVAGNGENIICSDNDGWRWEPN